MKGLARWRIVAALAVVAGLAVFGVEVGPIYIHNLQLQSFVGTLTARPENLSQGDDALRQQVLKRAQALDLPVRGENVQIARREGSVRIDVRYIVRVDLPGYTVDLHFYPGAGSR